MSREQLEALTRERDALRTENSVLRGLLARLALKLGEPCHYCGLSEIARCPSGFPGCALADDLLLGNEEAFRDWANRTKTDRT